MLHKSFKPAKCKTALKLAASRIKLLKNKKDAQVKQLKRDVAQLLESGQDQTARIRVEHVVREEKMMAAYDLIEIFCELIAARLQIIESQKNCPIDLKEAVTSVVFASPRCADIPELMDVRKHFTAKYGKEFINGAIELRPDCGVNRMLVEKLSATAPDGPTKLKILTAIAEEHNIKWEPKSFGEKDSKYYEDLLNGPKTFEDASKMHRGAPNVQTQHYEKGPPTADVTPQTEWKQNASQKFQGDNIGSSFDYQQNTQAHPSVSAFSPSELKPSVDEREPMEHRRAYSGDMKDGIMGNQDWKMEFKDATSAAQAAAESAERASMAARAAAELSSRGRSGGRYASELQKPSGYGFRDEHLERSQVSSHQSEVFAREQASTNVERRTHQMQNEPTNINEHYYHEEAAESYQREGQKNINESSQFGSSKLRMGSVDNDLLSRPSVYGQNDERHVDPNSHNEAAVTNPIGNSFKASIPRMQRNQIDAKRQDGFEEVTESFYRESHKNTPEFSQSYSINSNTDGSHDKSLLNSSLLHGVYTPKNFSGPENNSHILDDGNLSRKSSKSEAEFVHEISNDAEYKNSNDWEDRSYRKHSMHVSSHSQTSFSHSSSEKQDVWNLNNNNFEDGATENPFACFDEGKSHKDTGVSYGGSAVHYDNYGDDGNYSFDLDKGPESSFDHPSTRGSSLSRMFSDNHKPSPGSIAVDPFQKSTSHSPFFTEQPSSKVSQSVAGSAFREEPDELPPPSFDEGPSFDKEVEPEDFSGDDENDFGIGFSKKYVSSPKRSLFNTNSKNRDSFDDVHDEKSHQGGQHLESSFIPEVEHDKFEVQLPDSPDDSDAYTLQESGFGSGSEWSFGKLTGGLRNKGHKQPPYVRSSMGETSSPKEAERVSSPLKVSVDSISRGDPHSKDNGTEFRSRPGTRLSASGTNVSQDGIYFSEDSSAVLTSNDIPGSFSQKLGPEKITRSSSRESIASTDSMQSNTDNNSQAQVSSGKTRFGSGLSRRTKPASANTVRVKSTFASEESASPENSSGRAASLRSSYQESTFASEEPENLIHGPNVKSSSRSSNSFKSSVKPQSGTIAAASSSNRAGSNLKSKFAHEESQTQELDEDIKYSLRSSYAAEASIKSQSGTRTAALSSDRLGFNRRRSRYASGELQTEHDDSVKASVRSSYASGSSMESRPETDQLEDRRTGREYRLPKEATVRPMAKPTGSSPEGRLRSRAEEKPSPSLEKTSSTGAAPESPKSGSPSADKRASHVHPKLPDYDTFAATLQAFRANRQ